MDIFGAYILLPITIVYVVLLAVFAKVGRDAIQTVSLIASISSLIFLFFAIDSVISLTIKISTGENLYIYLMFSLPLITVFFASSIICLASIPWLNLIAKRGEK